MYVHMSMCMYEYICMNVTCGTVDSLDVLVQSEISGKIGQHAVGVTLWSVQKYRCVHHQVSSLLCYPIAVRSYRRTGSWDTLL